MIFSGLLYECSITCQSEKKHIWNWTIILGIFHFHELFLCKQREIFVWLFNYTSEKKSTSGLELLVFFICLLTFFENINQEHNLLPDCACLWTVYVCTGKPWKMCASLFCLRPYTGNILFRSVPNGNCLFSSASLSLEEDNSLVMHRLRVLAAVKLHLNAAYVQHLALKSVYEKSQKCGKLFSSRNDLFQQFIACDNPTQSCPGSKYLKILYIFAKILPIFCLFFNIFWTFSWKITGMSSLSRVRPAMTVFELAHTGSLSIQNKCLE